MKHQHKVGKNEINDSICLLNVSDEQILSAIQRGHADARRMIK